MPELSNDAFRLLIKGKAMANISGCSISDLNRILQTLFPGRNAWVSIDSTPMAITYHLSGASDVEKNLLQNTNILPRPTGVAVSFSFT